MIPCLLCELDAAIQDGIQDLFEILGIIIIFSWLIDACALPYIMTCHLYGFKTLWSFRVDLSWKSAIEYNPINLEK